MDPGHSKRNAIVKKQKKTISVPDREEMASWKEVFNACFKHTGAEWAALLPIWLVCLICVYFLLFGFQLLGSGAKVMTGCQAGALFGHDQNPLTALMVGILATTFQQSSSTTIGIIISLVGVNVIDVQTGIYTVMGANIGTTITTTIVALGSTGPQLEGAFAGAVIHDLFNIFSVLILFPLECATGYLFRLTRSLVKGANPEDGEAWSAPVKDLVKPFSEKILISNKNVIRDVAKGVSECEDFYPIDCKDDENPTYGTCDVGLIACSKSTGQCPAFFNANATQSEDLASGFVVFVLGLFIVFFCIFLMASMVPRLFTGVPKRIIKRGTTINGYLSIFIATGFTMFIGSSSVALSFVPPLVGTGLVGLEEMLPYTIGANFGTTLSNLLSALVTEGTDALQIALAHFFFNVTAGLIWFAHPFMRRIIITQASNLGRLAGLFQGFPIFYIIATFIVIPLYLFTLSELFTTKEKNRVIIASVMTVVMLVGATWLSWFWFYTGGRETVLTRLAQRKRRLMAYETLPEDMDYIQTQLVRIAELCGGAASGDSKPGSTSTTNTSQDGGLDDSDRTNPKAATRELNKTAFLVLHEHMDDIMSRLAAVANYLGLTVDDAEEGTTEVADGDDEGEGDVKAVKETGIQRVLAEVPKIYLLGALCLSGLYFWGVVALFLIHSHTANAMAIIMISLGFFYFVRFVVWWIWHNGEEITYKYWLNRRRRKQMRLTLHHDLERIQTEIELLAAKCGLSKARR